MVRSCDVGINRREIKSIAVDARLNVRLLEIYHIQFLIADKVPFKTQSSPGLLMPAMLEQAALHRHCHLERRSCPVAVEADVRNCPHPLDHILECSVVAVDRTLSEARGSRCLAVRDTAPGLAVGRCTRQSHYLHAVASHTRVCSEVDLDRMVWTDQGKGALEIVVAGAVGHTMRARERDIVRIAAEAAGRIQEF